MKVCKIISPYGKSLGDSTISQVQILEDYSVCADIQNDEYIYTEIFKMSTGPGRFLRHVFSCRSEAKPRPKWNKNVPQNTYLDLFADF
jgi:hypothetical protein